MTTFTNGESGLSVRTKINESITKTDFLTVSAATDLDAMRVAASPELLSTSRPDLVTWWATNGADVVTGTIVSDGTVQYVKDGGTSITDLSGLSPFGNVKDGHYARDIDDIEAVSGPVQITEDISTSKVNFNSLDGPYFTLNNSQISTTGGKLPFRFSSIRSAPTKGVPGSFLTAFDGDVSGILDLAGNNIRGSSTMGQPTTGYEFTRETSLQYHYTYFDSGYNHSTSDDTGRTGYIQSTRNITHAGQGDAIANHAAVTVSATNSSSTHFLANPAGVLYGGSLNATTSGANLTVGEISLYDNGNDTRGTGFVFGFYRDSAVGSKSNFWSGVRYVSQGTQECEAAVQAVGSWNVAFDGATAEVSGAVLTLRPEQIIEFNAEAPADSAGVRRWSENLNGWSIGYEAAGNKLSFKTAGTEAFRVGSSGVVVPGTNAFVVSTSGGIIVNGGAATFSGGALNLTGGNLSLTGRVIAIDGAQVLGARKTGWTAPTGASSKGTFDPSTVTTEQLAQRVHALIDDLTNHGIIGA